MLHRTGLLGLLICAVLFAPAGAQPPAGDCLIGPGLGASLLIPYFEVDLDNAEGATTLISINNGLSGAALTRVVLWTDWGVPTLAFDLFLDGFEVKTIDLRSIFTGIIPSSGESADLSGFPFCLTLPPFHNNPILTPNGASQLAAYHTGVFGPLNAQCAGEAYFDNIARGYVTVDVVQECSGLEPLAPFFTPANTLTPYFVNGGNGIASNENRLWGDVVFVNFDENSAQGMDAVSLWADSSLFAGGNIFTFYGRYSNWDGRDDRVPLPWLWNQRYLNGGPFEGGATLIVWRDTGLPNTNRVNCSATPAWWPLRDNSAAFNEQFSESANLGPRSFPNATQRIDVDSLDVPFAFGWIQFNPGANQTWVQPTLTAARRYSAGLNGVPVDFLCDETPISEP